jgi:hypothetical protein
VKTPIRNPYGATKANKIIEQIIPVGSVVSSYGFYSGEVEFNLSNRERFVSSHTSKKSIYEFWQTIFEDPNPTAEIASRILPLRDEKEFSVLQERWNEYKNPDVRAALFFLLNNCSDSGYISKGSMDIKNYNPVSLSRLKKFIKPQHHHLSLIEDSLSHMQSNEKSDYILIQLEKYKIDMLTEGINRGPEEEYLVFTEVLRALQDKKFIILTKPSSMLNNMKESKLLFIDKYGRQTYEREAEELIIYNE